MSSGILSGIKVADFTHIFAGPFATQILGDLGADVVKIERVDGGDATRYYGLTDKNANVSGPFLALNRNKRSLAVDLSEEPGRAIVKRLVRECDVVVENFSDGVMRRWGLDYEALAPEHPGLVYCAISGFGRVGPMAGKAANDLVVQAYSGLLSFTGEPGRPPVRCGTAISDFSAGLYAALAIVAALLHRSRTGTGQVVETSLLESQLSFMNYFFAEYWLQGVVPQPMGTANRLGMPNQAFPTRDGYVVITAANDRMWQRCCAGIGQPGLASDPRFASLADRYHNREELVGILSARTSQMTTEECVEALSALGVSCARINTVADIAADPQLELLGSVLEVAAGDGEKHRVIASAFHLSETPTTYRAPVPQLGGGTTEVLADLGYSEAEVEDLVARGVVRTPG